MNAQPLKILPNRPKDIDSKLGKIQLEISQISEINKKIDANNKCRKMLSKLDIQDATTIAKQELEPTDEYVENVGAFTASIRQARAELAKYEKMADNCHACGQPLETETRDQMIEKLTKQIEMESVTLNKNKKWLDSAKNINPYLYKIAHNIVIEKIFF